MPSEVLVDVQNLVKTFGPLRALDGLSFQVRRGEIVGLLGCNGAGKSTLMRVLTCYLSAESGTASIAGLAVDRQPLEVRRRVGYLPENAPLYTEMRVCDFLGFVARMREVPRARRPERIEWAVESCGLRPKYLANIGTLSRGYRQRVGIAQAILHDPDLLILDEPTSGLDPLQIIEIRNLIMEIGRRKTVFFSTHIMQEVEAVCSRALIISKGRLAADGAPAELKARAGRKGRLVAKLRGVAVEAAREALGGLAGVRGVEVAVLPDQGVLSCTLQLGAEGHAAQDREINQASEALFALARERGWSVLEWRSEGLSLEDAFLQYAGRPDGDPSRVEAGAVRAAVAEGAGAGVAGGS